MQCQTLESADIILLTEKFVVLLVARDAEEVVQSGTDANVWTQLVFHVEGILHSKSHFALVAAVSVGTADSNADGRDELTANEAAVKERNSVIVGLQFVFSTIVSGGVAGSAMGKIEANAIPSSNSLR